MTINVELVTVTPEMAKEWLNNMYHKQRPFKKSRAKEYAHDMSNGNWMLESSEMIKFNKDGQLIDGQHRLSAVVMSEMAVPFFVMTGARNEAYDTIDSGAKRSVSDVLKTKYGTTISALSRAMLQIDKGAHLRSALHGGSKRDNVLVSKKDVVDYYRLHSEYIDKLAQFITKFGTVIGKTSSQGVGLPLYVYGGIDQFTVDYFINDVLNAVPKDERIAGFKNAALTAIIKDNFDKSRQFAMIIRTLELIDNDEPPIAKYTNTDQIIKRWDDYLHSDAIQKVTE